MASLPKGITVLNGKFENLPPRIKEFVAERAALCKPDSLHICDGSDEENRKLIGNMVASGQLTALTKYEDW